MMKYLKSLLGIIGTDEQEKTDNRMIENDIPDYMKDPFFWKALKINMFYDRKSRISNRKYAPKR